MYMSADRNVAQFRRSPVKPDHAVGEHGKIMEWASVITFPTISIQPQATPAIDGVHDHQFAREVGAGIRQRKLTRLKDMVCRNLSLQERAERPCHTGQEQENR